MIKHRISILGCGWYGFELAQQLSRSGHQVKGSTTSAEKITLLEQNDIKPYLIHLGQKDSHIPADFFDSEILIIAIPPKRATQEQGNFLSKIEQIVEMASVCQTRHIIFISSTAVYGEPCIEVDELSTTLPTTDSAKAMLTAERLLQASSDFSTTIIRFGGLVGPGRDPGKFFAGKKDVPNGKAPINLLHLKDCIGITLSIIEKHAYGNIFNACCPDHPKKMDFYLHASISSGLPLPEFIDELKDWKIISGNNVSGLLNYTYKVNNWESWLTIKK